MLRLREMDMDVVKVEDVGGVKLALAEVEEVTGVVEDVEQVKAEVEEAHDLMVCTSMSVRYMYAICIHLLHL